MSFEKLFNEIYAAISLWYFWTPCEGDFVKSESPDWLNPHMSLGMEVSQAILQEDGEAGKTVNLYLGKKREEIPEAALRRYENRTYFYNDRLWAIFPEGAAAAGKNCYEKALYRFEKKLEKLNGVYSHTDISALYLYMHRENILQSEIFSLFEKMEQRQRAEAYRFDYVFLNCNSVLYILDFIREEIESVTIPAGAAAFLERKTEELRHSGAWENGRPLTEKMMEQNGEQIEAE